MPENEKKDGLRARVESLRARDQKSIELLVDEFTQPLLAAAFGFGFVESDAEELVQDVFVGFLDGVEKFEMRSSLKTYLFGILYNKGRELRRRRAREEHPENIDEIFEGRFNLIGIWSRPAQGPEEETASKELKGWIEKCSEGLSADQRAAFYFKEVDQMPAAEICSALNVSESNLGVLLFRARNKLRECLEKKWRQA